MTSFVKIGHDGKKKELEMIVESMHTSTQFSHNRISQLTSNSFQKVFNILQYVSIW